MQPTRPADPDLAAQFRAQGHWRDLPISHFLNRAGELWPDAVAVCDGERRFTFGEIDRSARAFAAALLSRGVGSGDVVAFQLPNCAEAVVVYQAIQKLGAVANPIVPIYRFRELRFILAQAGAKVAVIGESARGIDYPVMYGELRSELPDLELIVSVGAPERGAEQDSGRVRYRDLLDNVAPADLASIDALPAPDPDSVCLLLYTSGTTADPKGVLHSHNTVIFENQSMIDTFDLTSDDVIFNPSPVTHITGANCALALPFVLGAPVVLQGSWDPDVALEKIIAERATFMIFATPFLQGLVDSAIRTNQLTPAIRYIVCGGADIPDSLAAAATERLGVVTRMYGASEGPSATTATLADSVYLRTSTDGRPIAPTEVKIFDGAGRPAETGDVAEIHWRGPDTFLGYLDASLNDSAFTADGFFRTGDLGRFDELGGLHFTGRLKDIINRSGEKFSTHDIENQLSAHPDIVEVAVVAGPDSRTGERGCAFVVTYDGRALSLADLHSFLVDRGIAIQKIPESLYVVDALPKTASGKIRKPALRALTNDHAKMLRQPAGMRIIAAEER